MSEAHPGQHGARMAWVDAARGTSVLLVVVFHVILWHVDAYSAELWEPAARLWSRLNGILGSVRIPLLLGVSGMLASSAIRAGWGDRRNLVRAAANYYLYVVWLLVYAVFFWALRSPEDLPHRISGVGDLVSQLALPDTTLWYVFALAVYTVVLSLARGVPAWLQVGVLVVVCVAVRFAAVDDWQVLKVPEVALFFALGVHAGPSLRRLADSTGVLRVLAAAVLAVVVTLGGRVLTGEVGGSLLFIARGCAFLVFMVLAVALVVRVVAPVGRALALLGRHTLPIYVIHPLVIYLVMAATAGRQLGETLANPLVALSYPVLVVVLACAASLGLRAALRSVGLGVMFEMPAAWRDRLRPAPVT